MSGHEKQVISLLDKIRSLNQEKEKIIGQVSILRSLITPKMDIMLSGLEDAQATMKSLETSNLRSV